MHNAPAVSFPVGRSYFQAGLLLAIVLSGAAAAALWIYQVDRPGWPQGLVVGAWLLTASAAAYNWSRAQAGVLHWDGQSWHVESGRAVLAGQVLLRLDLQASLLLEFRPEAGRPQWLWLERGAEMLRWDALRRALCARVGVASPGSAHAGRVNP